MARQKFLLRTADSVAGNAVSSLTIYCSFWTKRFFPFDLTIIYWEYMFYGILGTKSIRILMNTSATELYVRMMSRRSICDRSKALYDRFYRLLNTCDECNYILFGLLFL